MDSKLKLPPLLVRADANEIIGMGHVMRCLALAEGWRECGGRVTFLSASRNQGVRARIEGSGLTMREIPTPHPDSVDLNTTLEVIEELASGEMRAPWVVVDGYQFDPHYQSLIRASGCRLLVIDDQAHLSCYDADMVVNHAHHAERLTYPTAKDTLLLLGTRYALLRAEFQRKRNIQRVIPEHARKILVTFGGSDPDNLTVTVVQALQQIADPGLEAQVLVGPTNPHKRDLERATRLSSVRIILRTDVTEVSSLMAWADLAIAAGGTTAWELAYMQVPALLVALAENQVGTVNALAEFEAACSLGAAREVTAGKMTEILGTLVYDRGAREKMVSRERAIVDGQGVKRVIGAMLYQGDELIFRPATLEDSLLLWEWANDTETRGNSFHSGTISWESHANWYAAKLISLHTRIWILEWHGIPVGQIRCDRVDPATARISIGIARNYRGRNLGSWLLRAPADAAAQELGVKWLQGITFSDNRASARAFLKAGFKLVRQEAISGHACSIFERRCKKEPCNETVIGIH